MPTNKKDWFVEWEVQDHLQSAAKNRGISGKTIKDSLEILGATNLQTRLKVLALIGQIGPYLAENSARMHPSVIPQILGRAETLRMQYVYSNIARIRKPVRGLAMHAIGAPKPEPWGEDFQLGLYRCGADLVFWKDGESRKFPPLKGPQELESNQGYWTSQYSSYPNVYTAINFGDGPNYYGPPMPIHSGSYGAPVYRRRTGGIDSRYNVPELPDATMCGFGTPKGSSNRAMWEKLIREEEVVTIGGYEHGRPGTLHTTTLCSNQGQIFAIRSIGPYSPTNIVHLTNMTDEEFGRIFAYRDFVAVGGRKMPPANVYTSRPVEQFVVRVGVQ